MSDRTQYATPAGLAVLDFEQWRQSLPAPAAAAVENQIQRSYDPDGERKRIASRVWLAERTKYPTGFVDRNYDAVKAAYGAAVPMGDAWKDDATLQAWVTSQAATERDENVMVRGYRGDTDEARKAQAESLVTVAYEAGAEAKAKDPTDVYASWVEANKLKPSFIAANAANYWKTFSENHAKGVEDLRKAREAAELIFPTLAAEKEGAHPAEALRYLRGLDETQQALAFREIAEMGKANAGKGKAWSDNVGEAGTAGGRVIQDIAEGLKNTVQNIGEAMSDPTNLDEPSAEDVAADQLLVRKLFQARRGSVFPIGKDTLWRKATIGAVEALPFMAAAATGAGLAAITASYTNDAELNLLEKGIPLDKARALSMVIGPVQAAIDKLQLTMLKKAPGLNRIFQKWNTNAVALAGGRLVAIVAGETVAELVQDPVVPAAVQEVASWWDESIPGVKFADVWGDVKSQALDVVMATIPLALLGVGAATARDIKAADQVSRDPEALGLLGFSPDHIKTISTAADGQAVAELKRFWNERTPKAKGDSVGLSVGEAAAAAVKAPAISGDGRTSIPENIEAEANREAGIVALRRDDNGWSVVFEDGKRVNVGTVEAAYELRAGRLMAETAKEAEGFIRVLDALHTPGKVTTITGNQVVYAPGEGVKELSPRGEALSSPAKPDAAIAELDREFALLGIKGGGIGGSNFVREGVQHVVLNQSKRGALTALHESLETVWKAGKITPDEVKAAAAVGFNFFADAVDQAERPRTRNTRPRSEAEIESDRQMASRLQRISLGKASETEARETMVELVVANILGGKMRAGALSAAVDGAIRSARAPGERLALGRFRSFLRAARAYFRAVFATAAKIGKARREGADITALDLLTDKLLGLDPQRAEAQERQHAAAVTKEASETFALEDVPNSLMGFPKEGPTKPFDEQRYPFVQAVRVTWPDGQTHDDAVKGMNAAHALERARRNWPGAEIEAIEGGETFAVELSDSTAPVPWRREGIQKGIPGDPEFPDLETFTVMAPGMETTFNLPVGATDAEIQARADERAAAMAARGETFSVEPVETYALAEKAIERLPEGRIIVNKGRETEHFSKDWPQPMRWYARKALGLFRQFELPVAGLGESEQLTAVRQWYEKRFGYGGWMAALRLGYWVQLGPNAGSSPKDLATTMNEVAFIAKREAWSEGARQAAAANLLRITSDELGQPSGEFEDVDFYGIYSGDSVIESDDSGLVRVKYDASNDQEFEQNVDKAILWAALNAYSSQFSTVEDLLGDIDPRRHTEDYSLGSGHEMSKAATEEAARRTAAEPEQLREVAIRHYAAKLAKTAGEFANRGDFSFDVLDTSKTEPLENYLDSAETRMIRDIVIYGLSDEVFDVVGQGSDLSKAISRLRDAPETYSVEPAGALEDLARKIAARITNPTEKLNAYTRAHEKFLSMARAIRHSGDVAEAVTKAAIEKERVERRASKMEELFQAIDQDFGDLSGTEFMAAAMNNPVMDAIFTKKPGEKFARSRIRSHATAIREGRDTGGDYDGAHELPFWLFGGKSSPDQIAQELFEEGLLRDPHTDTLWEAIDKALRSAGAARKRLKEYAERKREAREAAGAEARAWAAGELADLPERRDSRQKQDLSRFMAALDALLVVLPPEVRAKVGGWTKLASLSTNQARADFIANRIARTDVVFEEFLKKEYTVRMAKLMVRVNRKSEEAGKKPGSAIGPDAHYLLNKMWEAMPLNETDVDGLIAGLDTRIASGELEIQQEILAARERELINLSGDWKHNDAAQMAAAFNAAERTFDDGWLTWSRRIIARRQARQALRDRLIVATDYPDTDTERAAKRDARAEKDLGWRGKLKNAFLGLSSFDEAMRYAYGDSDAAREFVDRERAAANAKEDAIQGIGEAVADLFTRLAGSPYKGTELQWKLAQKEIDGGKAGKLSQLQVIQATLMWRQDDGRRHMEAFNYDQAWIDGVEGKLSDRAKQVRDFLSEQYAAEYAPLNALYRERHGVNLPGHDNYAPLTVKPMQARAGDVVDPVTGRAMGANLLTPGSLRSRSRVANAEPDFRDALQTYLGHVRQLEHWKSYYDLALDLNAVVGNRDVANATEAAAGEQAVKVLQGWSQMFAQGGNRDAAAFLSLNQSLGKMSGRAAEMILFGRAGTLMIQSTQLGAALAEMPTGSYVKRLGMLFAGQLGWRDALHSPYIQRRFNAAPPIVRQALDALAATEPNRIKHAARQMGRLIAGADALFTAGTYAIALDYHRGQGRKANFTGADLEAYAHREAERAVDRVAQPTRAGARSLFENSTTSPLARAGWAFASEARQKIALAAWATRGAKQDPANFARTLAVVWGAGGLAAAIIRSAWRDMKDDEDEDIFDERNWSAARLLAATVAGPLQGIPVFGDIVESGINRTAGVYVPGGDIFSQAQGGVTGAKKLVTGKADNAEERLKAAKAMLFTMGLANDTLAAASTLANVAEDGVKVVDNLNGD